MATEAADPAMISSTDLVSANDVILVATKKRLRADDDEAASSNKSSKLSTDAVPHDAIQKKKEEKKQVDIERKSMKHPYLILSTKSVRRGGPDTIVIQFKMASTDVELARRPYMNPYDEQAVDEDEEVDKIEGATSTSSSDDSDDEKKFVFTHFNQFDILNAKDDEAIRYEYEDEDTEQDKINKQWKSRYPEEQEKDVVLLKKFRKLRREHEEEMATIDASSADPLEDAWLKANGIKKSRMEFGTKHAKVRTLQVSIDPERHIVFRIVFTDLRVTKHKAVSALEQVLRQQAPASLKKLLMDYLETQRLNCYQMKKRFYHIYRRKEAFDSDYKMDDILIGDLIPFDLDGQNQASVENKVTLNWDAGRPAGAYDLKAYRYELDDEEDFESDDSDSDEDDGEEDNVFGDENVAQKCPKSLSSKVTVV